MAIKAKFPATIKGGKLVFQDQLAFIKHVAGHKEGTEVWVTVGKKQRDRTLSQNAWYWGCILPIIASETGHTVNELHEIYKRMFLDPKIITYREIDFKIPSTTTTTNTVEFTNYIEKVRAEAASMGIIIPDPDSIDYDWIDRV